MYMTFYYIIDEGRPRGNFVDVVATYVLTVGKGCITQLMS